MFSRAQIFQIFVVSPDQEWYLSLLQPMPPLLQGQFHSQQLQVPDIIVALGWEKKGTWVHLVIPSRPLRENGPYTHI